MSDSYSEQIEQFRGLIERRFGLIFDQSRAGQVVEIFETRRAEFDKSSLEYLTLLGTGSEEWGKIAELLTVPETYFFRATEQLRAFEEVVLPARLEAHEDNGNLQILSVGCATGEEPYTLAILCRFHEESLRGREVRISGIDASGAALEKARAGIYSEWSLRSTPASVRSEYFEKMGKKYRLKRDLIPSVSFERGNVLEFRDANRFDAVFFRNVLMYFSLEAARFAISRIAHSLQPGGYLFLGPAESLRGISDDFYLCHTHDTFYYQRKTAISARVERTFPLAEPLGVKTAALLGPLELGLEDVSWFENILESGRRIRELERQQRAPKQESPSGKLSAGCLPDESHENARETLLRLLRQEHYTEALSFLKALPDGIKEHRDISLLDAVLTLNAGNSKSAQLRCRRLLDRDEMDAGAHYAMALCLDQGLQHEDAASHDRVAIYLDPDFAMPHLHLALLLKRRGDLHSAKREFREAVRLIPREVDVRLLMFGGGFGSRVLVQLCEHEIQSLEAA